MRICCVDSIVSWLCSDAPRQFSSSILALPLTHRHRRRLAMLTRDDNEILTRVGPGTPMGELMRQHWQPVLLTSELPERDGPPLRVRHLSEDLVAFRDT